MDKIIYKFSKFQLGDKFIARRTIGNKPMPIGNFGSDFSPVYDKELEVVAINFDGTISDGMCTYHPDWCEKLINLNEVTIIDWESRRYEIAKDFMAAQINGYVSKGLQWDDRTCVLDAIYSADILIEELKLKNKDYKI